MFQLSYFDELPVTAKQISEATSSHDPILLEFTLTGWPNVVQDESLKPFFIRRTELSVEQWCVLWRRRVVIPPKYRSKILEDLHDQHPGTCRMKASARSYLWWPGSRNRVRGSYLSCLSSEFKDSTIGASTSVEFAKSTVEKNTYRSFQVGESCVFHCY